MNMNVVVAQGFLRERGTVAACSAQDQRYQLSDSDYRNVHLPEQFVVAMKVLAGKLVHCTTHNVLVLSCIDNAIEQVVTSSRRIVTYLPEQGSKSAEHYQTQDTCAGCCGRHPDLCVQSVYD